MYLADELLADLEDGVEEEFDNEEETVHDIEDVDMSVEDHGSSVRSVAKLRDSEDLKRIIDSIDTFSSKPKRDAVAGPVEADPEYKVIVDANNMTVEIDNEVNVIHQFIKYIYSKRFPELESLVPIALEYIGTVKTL